MVGVVFPLRSRMRKARLSRRVDLKIENLKDGLGWRAGSFMLLDSSARGLEWEVVE